MEVTSGDVRKVQLYARHANPTTTLRYADVPEDVAGAVARQVAAALDPAGAADAALAALGRALDAAEAAAGVERVRDFLRRRGERAGR